MKNERKVLMKRIVCFSIILMFTIILLSSVVYGLDTDKYENIYQREPGMDKIDTLGSTILAVVQTVGISVAIITLVVIGIQYMVAAPEKKADIKGRMIPFVIGAVIMFAASALLSIVAKFAKII